MYVNIIIYSNKLLLFVWSMLNKEKKKKKSTLAREHISTQGTLAREHVFSTQGTQFSRLQKIRAVSHLNQI